MKNYACIVALAGACALGAGSANAAVVYDNGAPDAANGNETTQWVQAEDFTFGADTNVTGAGVYIAGTEGLTNYDGNFQYYIFGDTGGNPGAVLQSGSITPGITDTGTPWAFGDNVYLFTFDFASTLNALTGVTYYLGIHANSDFADRDDIYWTTTAANGTGGGYESSGGTFDNWSINATEHAFYLTNDANGAVPEPATWAMMLLGFFGIGLTLRNRGQQAVRVRYS